MEIENLYRIYGEHQEVTTDSRSCPAGSMFFALKGDSFDGNRFAAKALESGASVAVVDDASVIPAGDERYVLVEDVLSTLQELAAYHRQQFKGPVVQVTGTNGKTTTKELIAAVLSERYRVLYTQGNLNNHIGVPLTLLRLRPESHEIAIIETGANHPGEIAMLTRLVQPDYGIVTNVGRAHIEGFGSFEGVKRTKGELYDYLAERPSCRIFANAGNADLREMLAERGVDVTGEKCLAYAAAEVSPATCLCTGGLIASNPMLRMWWQGCGHERHEVETHLVGSYNMDNVLAAVAVGLHFGVAADRITAALCNYAPSLGRSEYRVTAHNELIIDAYNANLTSMQAALENFTHTDHAGKMVILGEMRELGTASADAHRTIAELALSCGADRVWLVGDGFRQAIAAISGTDERETLMLRGVNVHLFKDVGEVEAAIAQDLPTGRFILIKGSNSTKLHVLPKLL